MSNIKYLYGKKDYLSQIIDGKGIIRFDSIANYSTLENKNMRDDEKNKKIIFDGTNTKKIEIEYSNKKQIYTFNKNDSAELIVNPVDCLCKCFSNNGYCDDLYNRFKADICLEIDIDLLIESLKAIFISKYPQIKVTCICSNITYYETISEIPNKFDTLNALFYKPFKFYPENEYRIVLMFNRNEINISESMIITVPEKESSYYYVINYRERGKT